MSKRSSTPGTFALPAVPAAIGRGSPASWLGRLVLLGGFIVATGGCPASDAPGNAGGSGQAGGARASGGDGGSRSAGSGGAAAGGSGGGGSGGSGSAGVDAGGGGGGRDGGGRDGGDSEDADSGGGNPDTATGESGDGPAPDADAAHFSFFVTSVKAMQRLSGSQAGFGGDLRFGQADGLKGADEICRQIAETSMPGASAKGWRAFLSATRGPDGQPVHAIDRIGEGPWYDRLGRLVARNKSDLVQTRPRGADPVIVNDLPNEDGVPNHAPDGQKVDNHDILTGSDVQGRVYSQDWSATCHDWTSKVGRDGKPRVGHAWPRRFGPGFPVGSAESWISVLDEAGCAPGVSLVEMGPPDPNVPTVGSGGGYGGIYCFALSP